MSDSSSGQTRSGATSRRRGGKGTPMNSFRYFWLNLQDTTRLLIYIAFVLTIALLAALLESGAV